MTSKTKTVYIHTLGCPKNEADSEYIAALLDERGFIPVSDPSEAQIVLINTCAFVDDAKEESVEAILEACAMKEENPDMKIGVFGCLAQRYAAELKKEIPEADWFIGTGSFNDIADIVLVIDQNEHAGDYVSNQTLCTESDDQGNDSEPGEDRDDIHVDHGQNDAYRDKDHSVPTKIFR